MEETEYRTFKHPEIQGFKIALHVLHEIWNFY